MPVKGLSADANASIANSIGRCQTAIAVGHITWPVVLPASRILTKRLHLDRTPKN